MRTALLFMDDSYLKECEATVLESLPGRVVLDRTVIHPRSGGLVSDTGTLKVGDASYKIVEAIEEGEEVVHMISGQEKIPPGQRVKVELDWERRYRIMRAHTALHVLISILNKNVGALVTGNQVTEDVSRVDLNLEKPDKELVSLAIAEANRILAEGHPVKIYYMSREEAMKVEGIVKLAKAMPPSVDKLRIVEIVGVDIQADGGPHVKDTKEVGQIQFLKLENKGKNNRRVYFKLIP
ncbi:MAG: alanyl-tRNA editing protein [Thermoprotei archaeon]|nr:alanyl-tRNA editing protein [Thermoprotei archaeon]